MREAAAGVEAPASLLPNTLFFPRNLTSHTRRRKRKRRKGEGGYPYGGIEAYAWFGLVRLGLAWFGVFTYLQNFGIRIRHRPAVKY